MHFLLNESLNASLLFLQRKCSSSALDFMLDVLLQHHFSFTKSLPYKMLEWLKQDENHFCRILTPCSWKNAVFLVTVIPFSKYRIPVIIKSYSCNLLISTLQYIYALVYWHANATKMLTETVKLANQITISNGIEKN